MYVESVLPSAAAAACSWLYYKEIRQEDDPHKSSCERCNLQDESCLNLSRTDVEKRFFISKNPDITSVTLIRYVGVTKHDKCNLHSTQTSCTVVA